VSKRTVDAPKQTRNQNLPIAAEARGFSFDAASSLLVLRGKVPLYALWAGLRVAGVHAEGTKEKGNTQEACLGPGAHIYPRR